MIPETLDARLRATAGGFSARPRAVHKKPGGVYSVWRFGYNPFVFPVSRFLHPGRVPGTVEWGVPAMATFRSVHRPGVQGVIVLALLAGFFLPGVEGLTAGPPGDTAPVRLFTQPENLAHRPGIAVQLVPEALELLRQGPAETRVRLPLSASREVELHLQRFEVTTPQTRFLVATGQGQTLAPPSQVLLYRGGVAGEPSSHAFLAVSPRGVVNGRITLADSERWIISSSAARVAGAAPAITIHQETGRGDPPDFAVPCGVTEAHRRTPPPTTVAGPGVPNPGPHVAFVAVDADQEYTQLFPDVASAEDYVVAVIGAISDIYRRDLNVRLILSFVRLWPVGGEPFEATDLGGFGDYWINNEDTTGLNLVHMFSGRRDTGYGGIAYLGGFCGGPTFGISAFFLGGFPSPIDDPDLGNWDVIVSAHEMGHNLGTFHTHDGYSPPIDDCGNTGAWALGEIMSYCHTTPGGLYNIEMRFSSRVQDVIADEVAFEGCLWFDCNDNSINDALDIGGVSADANGNGVPDECEDCNNNGVLDDADIAGGMVDIDANGVPDVCETDCDANTRPDEWETATALKPDANGNRVPDGCEADCDGDTFADFVEIAAAGSSSDVDRNGVPDLCEDCNNNTLRDWADAGRPDHVYVADLTNDHIREYHARSGVIERVLGAGLIVDPHDVVFGPDRRLYVASFGNHRVVRIDPDTGGAVVFVAAGAGGLSGPAGVAFGPDGQLYVSSNATNSVLKYDGTDGEFLGVFVAAGAGGLSGPRDLVFTPSGQLLVATSLNSVLKYDAVGALDSTFVTLGSGGLSGPRGMVFKPNGNLLVTSFNTNSILEYNAGGAFVGQFNDLFTLNNPWGIAIGPNGNVYTPRHTGPIRIIEYDIDSGVYQRSFIRGDSSLLAPTAFAFRPPDTALDCNANRLPDDCDINGGGSDDINGNQIPDECENFNVPTPVHFDSAHASPRFLPIVAPAVASATGGYNDTAIRVTMIDLQNPNPPHIVGLPPNFSRFESGTCTAAGETLGCARWLGPPGTFLESQDNPLAGSFRAARLQCTPYYHDWSAEGTVYVVGAETIPSSTYHVHSFASGCKGWEASCTAVSPPEVITTRRAGDVAPVFTPPSTTTQPDGLDVAALVDKFKSLPGAISKSVVQQQPNLPDLLGDVSALDVLVVVDYFKGRFYPFSGPCPCPSPVPCNATACASSAACGSGTCVRTCSSGGGNDGQPCTRDSHCPGGTCLVGGFCRDACGRCTP